MRNYSANDLFELAEWTQPKDVALGGAGDITGVVMPRDYCTGELMSPNQARKLAAQLLREADLHDSIFEAGVDTGRASLQPQMDMFKRTLEFARMRLTTEDSDMAHNVREVVEQMERALGIFKDEDHT